MRALVVSVGDCPNEVPFVAPRLPNASFMLPARGPKDRFVSVWNEDDTDYEDRGYDSPRQKVDYSGRDVAQALLFPPSQGGPTWAERGVFIAAGDKPTEAELVAAEKKRDAYRQKLIEEARFRFQKDRHSRNIGDEARWAAERMGLQDEWLPLAANPCPACGVAIPHTAVMCGRCGCIVDEKRYAEMKFVQVPGAVAAPGKGLRPAEAVR